MKDRERNRKWVEGEKREREVERNRKWVEREVREWERNRKWIEWEKERERKIERECG